MSELPKKINEKEFMMLYPHQGWRFVVTIINEIIGYLEEQQKDKHE